MEIFLKMKCINLRILIFIFFGLLFLSANSFSNNSAKITSFGIYNSKMEFFEGVDLISSDTKRIKFCFEINVGKELNKIALIEALSHPVYVAENGIETIGFSNPKYFKIKKRVAYGCVNHYLSGSFYDAKGIWKFTVEYQANDFVEKKFYIK